MVPTSTGQALTIQPGEPFELVAARRWREFDLKEWWTTLPRRPSEVAGMQWSVLGSTPSWRTR